MTTKFIVILTLEYLFIFIHSNMQISQNPSCTTMTSCLLNSVWIYCVQALTSAQRQQAGRQCNKQGVQKADRTTGRQKNKQVEQQTGSKTDR